MAMPVGRWWQAAAIGATALGFYVVALQADAGHRTYLLWMGTALFAVATVASARLGEAGSASDSIPISIGTMIVIAIPGASLVPWGARFALGMLLAQLTVQMIWAVHRYPELGPVRSTLQERLRTYLGVASIMAAGFALLAGILVGLGYLSGDPGGPTYTLPILGLIIVAYFVGGALAAVTGAVCRPLMRWPVGTVFVGLIAGTLVYGTFTPIVWLLDANSEPFSVGGSLGIAITCGAVVGVPLAQWMRLEPW